MRIIKHNGQACSRYSPKTNSRPRRYRIPKNHHIANTWILVHDQRDRYHCSNTVRVSVEPDNPQLLFEALHIYVSSSYDILANTPK
jgi:hypothetical protein